MSDLFGGGLTGGGTIAGNLVITGDLTVDGDFNFGNASTDVLKVAGHIIGSVAGNTSVRIGVGTPVQFSAESTDDFFITGELEVLDTIYAGGIIKVLGGAIWPGIGSDKGLAYSGTITTRGGFFYRTDEGSHIVAGDSDGNGNHIINIISGGNVTKDHDTEVFQTNPTVNIFSATDPDTDNKQKGTFVHNQTNFVISTTTGAVEVSGFISRGAAVSKTIASGVIAATSTYVTMVVEGGAGSGADALTSVTGGAEGYVLILKTTTSGANDTVTVTDGTGAGTFIMEAGANFVMDTVDDRIEFLHNGTEWVEQTRSDNS